MRRDTKESQYAPFQKNCCQGPKKEKGAQLWSQPCDGTAASPVVLLAAAAECLTWHPWGRALPEEQRISADVPLLSNTAWPSSQVPESVISRRGRSSDTALLPPCVKNINQTIGHSLIACSEILGPYQNQGYSYTTRRGKLYSLTHAKNIKSFYINLEQIKNNK